MAEVALGGRDEVRFAAGRVVGGRDEWARSAVSRTGLLFTEDRVWGSVEASLSGVPCAWAWVTDSWTELLAEPIL